MDCQGLTAVDCAFADGGLAWRNNLDNLNEKDIDNDFNFRTD